MAFSDNLFWHSIWHSILAFYLTFYSDILFWHSIRHLLFWHPIWHCLWHYIWHLFWHPLLHSLTFYSGLLFCLCIWHSFWHSSLTFSLTWALLDLNRAPDLSGRRLRAAPTDIWTSRLGVRQVPTEPWSSRLRARQCPRLRYGSARWDPACSWGPAVPTQIGSSQLRFAGGEVEGGGGGMHLW